MRDQKFYEQVKDYIIFKTLDDEYTTLKDYLDKNREKHENQVYYVNDETQQAQYIRLFKEQDLDAVYLNNIIDTHFISFLEMNEGSVKFKRVDSDISQSLKDDQEKGDEKVDRKTDKTLEKLFKEAIDKDDLKIEIEGLKNRDIPAMVLLSEESRRMEEMIQRFGDMGMNYPMPKEETLIINRSSDLVKSLIKLSEDESRKDDLRMICRHIYDLALVAHKPLSSEEMMDFIERGNKILTKLAAL
jgi:molecular chaperone HtpG